VLAANKTHAHSAECFGKNMTSKHSFRALLPVKFYEHFTQNVESAAMRSLRKCIGV
jgi:hypothetical protein